MGPFHVPASWAVVAPRASLFICRWSDLQTVPWSIQSGPTHSLSVPNLPALEPGWLLPLPTVNTGRPSRCNKQAAAFSLVTPTYGRPKRISDDTMGQDMEPTTSSCRIYTYSCPIYQQVFRSGQTGAGKGSTLKLISKFLPRDSVRAR